jgi:hypothetical protein
VYFVGFTGSLAFPVSSNALQKTYGGGSYSTFFGSSQADQGDAIAWARNGVVLMSGSMWSPDFPHVGASFGPKGDGDAFVARVKPGDATLIRAVIVGGKGTPMPLALPASTHFPKLRPIRH